MQTQSGSDKILFTRLGIGSASGNLQMLSRKHSALLLVLLRLRGVVLLLLLLAPVLGGDLLVELRELLLRELARAVLVRGPPPARSTSVFNIYWYARFWRIN